MTVPGAEVAVATIATGSGPYLSVPFGSGAVVAPALTVAFEGEGRPVEVHLSARVAHSIAGQTVLVQLLQDGVVYDQREFTPAGSDKWDTGEFSSRLDASRLPVGVTTTIEVAVKAEWAGIARLGGDVTRQTRVEVIAR